MACVMGDAFTLAHAHVRVQEAGAEFVGRDLWTEGNVRLPEALRPRNGGYFNDLQLFAGSATGARQTPSGNLSWNDRNRTNVTEMM